MRHGVLSNGRTAGTIPYAFHRRVHERPFLVVHGAIIAKLLVLAVAAVASGAVHAVRRARCSRIATS